jgi:hypothetical protein
MPHVKDIGYWLLAPCLSNHCAAHPTLSSPLCFFPLNSFLIWFIVLLHVLHRFHALLSSGGLPGGVLDPVALGRLRTWVMMRPASYCLFIAATVSHVAKLPVYCIEACVAAWCTWIATVGQHLPSLYL